MESNQHRPDQADRKPDSDPLIGILIDGRYRVNARLARGGMASVYRALDERLDRPVAVKVMHPHLAESPQFNARFGREARAAARISHPGVVPVYDQGEVNGQGYLVMELIDGSSLRKVLAKHSPLDLETALSYCSQMLTAVAAAHSVGVIHRDLKPENVLITRGGAVKVVDFGLARALTDTSMSTTGSILGTVAYLAPEVAQSGVADQRTDLYAIGLILFEMLTGQLPWPDEAPLQSAYWRVHNDLPAPSTLVPWLPTEVDDLVFALCARDPQDRPSDAESALSLVAKVQRALPQSLLQRELPQAESKATSIPDTQQLEAAGKTATLPVSRVLVHTSGTSSPKEVAEPRRTKRVPIIVLIVVLVLGVIGAGSWWWAEYGPGSYIEVPDLAGKSQVSAQEELKELNLSSRFDETNSDTVEKGLVIKTDPGAGTRVHKDEEVTVFVSLGIRMITVPDLDNDPADEAKKALNEAGFSKVSVEEVYSETISEGHVVQIAPAPGQVIAHNAAITLQVSKGRQPIEVPSLVGQDVDSAKETLAGLGLESSVAEEYSDTVEQGQVIAQHPTADSDPLFRGDTVDLTVSLGPQYIEVPNVRGRSLDDAESALKEAGFEVEIQRIANLLDLVGSQSPAGGEMARKGSTVTLSVV